MVEEVGSFLIFTLLNNILINKQIKQAFSLQSGGNIKLLFFGKCSKNQAAIFLSWFYETKTSYISENILKT